MRESLRLLRKAVEQEPANPKYHKALERPLFFGIALTLLVQAGFAIVTKEYRRSALYALMVVLAVCSLPLVPVAPAIAVVVAAMLFLVGPALISGYAAATSVELEELDAQASHR